MARPYVFISDTTLYHPSEGARVFPAGETDPGPAWFDSPGGAPADKGTTKQAMKDLIAAQDQIDALGGQLAAKDHDLAVIAAERDAANGKVADLEQRAIAAEKAQAEAEDAAKGYMHERDAARADAKRFSDTADAYRADVEKVPGLVEQLNAANQTIADLNSIAAEPARGKRAAKPADTGAGEGAGAASDA